MSALRGRPPDALEDILKSQCLAHGLHIKPPVERVLLRRCAEVLRTRRGTGGGECVPGRNSESQRPSLNLYTNHNQASTNQARAWTFQISCGRGFRGCSGGANSWTAAHPPDGR